MENKLQLFNFNGSEVRTLVIDDEPYFVGNDVAKILGYKRVGDALKQHVDSDERKTLTYKAFGDLAQSLWKGNDFSSKTVITESGVYSLIFGSELPNAKQFKHWVTHEVLPAIRKHGAYLTPDKIEEVLLNPDTLIKLATELKKEREGRMLAEQKIQQDRPKVVFADAVSASDTPILIGELAKILKQNGIEIGQNRLFAWLRSKGYLISRNGTDYNTPTQKSMELCLFKIKERTRVSSDGSVKITKTSMVTGKGQQYFVNKFLGEKSSIK